MPRATNPGSELNLILIQRNEEEKAFIVVGGERPQIDLEREQAQVKGIEACLSQLALRPPQDASNPEPDTEGWKQEDEYGLLPVIYEFDELTLLRSNL